MGPGLVRALALAASLAPLPLLVACGGKPAPAPVADAEGWHAFEGSWTAAGRRRELAFGEGRRVAVVEASGSLVLSGPSRPGQGFRGEALTFSDEQTGLVGRAVWTDENGDQVFSELSAEHVRPGARITGRIVGGTGRFAGATGEYGFQWQYQIESDDGVVQGRTIGLAGRVRAGVQAAVPPEPPAPPAEGPK